MWCIGTICLGLLACNAMKGDKKMQNSDRVLKFGMKTTGWGPLFPPQHYSFFASIIMSHVYESLINVDDTGGYVPGLAKAWDVNENYTVYTLLIDTEKRFSNGTPLTAKICKDAFLHALKIEKKEKGKKALDLLYALKGYSKFDSTSDIEGVTVQSNNTLQLEFAKPFRRTIELLSGIRYAIYLNEDGKYLGTGPYIFKAISPDSVELHLNPFYSHKPSIERVLISGQGLKELNEGKVDVIFSYPEAETISGTNKKIKKLSSLIYSHRTILVNGMSGSLLVDKNLRKAVQYIIRNDIVENYSKNKDSYFNPGAQFYPPLSPGHLTAQEEEAIISQGGKYIDVLRIKSQKKPVRCYLRQALNYDFCSVLEKIGIRTQKHSIEYADMKKILFETHEADLLAGRVSYASADPDGLYDLFGKNSMLRSPFFAKPDVENLLEEGRTLTDPKLIDKHYQKISRTILDEVPVIHLGNEYIYLEYNSDVIEPIESVVAKRDYINAMLFQWKHRQ